MPEARTYSQRLGAISDAQFEAVAARLNLGRFVRAEPVTSGLFGQNVFVTTTAGEFVLRGAPHYVKNPGENSWRREDRWQFTKEVFFARQLHEHTKAPVPWPMLHDEASDIFGWPYLIMPRMPGTCFEERSVVKALPAEDRRGVAVAMGRMLAQMQRLSWAFAGDFSQDDIQLRPYIEGFTPHVIAEIREAVAMAQANGAMTAADVDWIERAEALALAVAGVSRPNTYVHCDYKLNNLTVLKDAGGWRVSGLFDLHEARFGDGAIDLVRQACSYLDTDPALARVFFEAYRNAAPADPTLGERLPLYIVNDRMKFWGFFTQPAQAAEWTRGKTFRGWAQRYMDGLLALL
jgi:Ser/Thr protein kinase RdoA (MazF antagonist)